MTKRQESVARGVLVTVGSALLIGVATAAWSSKESVSRHDTDMAAIHSDMERLLDAFCESNPSPRACRTVK
jgi:hypothetical protein